MMNVNGRQWTICPNSPAEGPVDDLCPKCDTLKSVHGTCRHQALNVPTVMGSLES